MIPSPARAGLVACGAAAALALSALTSAAPASAAIPTFKTCAAMHAHAAYKGGIGKVGAKDHRSSGHAKYKPYRSNAGYAANKKLDRDHDGIACEQ